MIKINRRSSFLRPLLVTALPLVLLEASTMTAYSTCVSVTGTNGGPRANGGAATAAATTDPSSCAATTGGNGGSGVLINGNPYLRRQRRHGYVDRDHVDQLGGRVG